MFSLIDTKKEKNNKYKVGHGLLFLRRICTLILPAVLIATTRTTTLATEPTILNLHS